MSTIVDTRVRALSTQLELLASASLPTLLSPATATRAWIDDASATPAELDPNALKDSRTAVELLNKLLITPGSPLPTVSDLRSTLLQYLASSSDSQISESNGHQEDIADAYEDSSVDAAKEAEWYIVAAASLVLYGNLLDSLLNQTLPLSEDIFYWDSVLSTQTGLLVYSVQIAPLRLLGYGKEILTDARRRIQVPQPSLREWITTLQSSFRRRRRVMQHMSFLSTGSSKSVIRKVLSPMSEIYNEVQSKQQQLKHLRDLQSAALGLLVGEEISFNGEKDWRRSVENVVSVMSSIVRGVSSSEDPVEQFEEQVCAVSTTSRSSRPPPFLVARQIVNVIDVLLPAQSLHQKSVTSHAGKPSLLTRYWPIGLGTLLFGGTALQMLFNRRASIAQWARDFAGTAADFWKNWIVEPVQNIISTIRHDDTAQVAIVGRKSLEADMQSLERMVVDFSIDTSKNLTDAEIEMIRAGVREGDVSTVLRVYEKELKSPFASAIKGELVRTLLIQMQKTKVDVELAITGIDRLLKSQELVFGFVAAMPSSIACWVLTKWFARLYSGQGVRSKAEIKDSIVRTLGNVERILTVTLHDTNGEWLSYSSQGVVLCEVHLLRNSIDVIPRELRADWARDLGDLEEIKLGVRRQRETIERIWRVYGKYFQ